MVERNDLYHCIVIDDVDPNRSKAKNTYEGSRGAEDEEVPIV